MAIGFAVAVGLVVAAPGIIQVMAGATFADAVYPLRIQAAAVLATFLLAPVGLALLSLHAPRETVTANTVALLVVVAVPLLASAHGDQGAAGWAPDVAPSLLAAIKGPAAAGPAVAVGLLTGLPAAVAGGSAP